MDIVTSALLAGVTHLGKKSIDDAYNGIKAVLKKKFGNRKLTESIDDLESNPISRVYQKRCGTRLKWFKQIWIMKLLMLLDTY